MGDQLWQKIASKMITIKPGGTNFGKKTVEMGD
jgi:hypothetical protein